MQTLGTFFWETSRPIADHILQVFEDSHKPYFKWLDPYQETIYAPSYALTKLLNL
jgi:hypothetical protein